MDNLRRNLENDLLNLLNDFVRPTNQRTQSSQPVRGRATRQATASGHRGFSNDNRSNDNRSNSGPIHTDMQYYRLQLLNNLITDYNENINEYNRVIRSYINLIRDTFHETTPVRPEHAAAQEARPVDPAPAPPPNPQYIRNPFNMNAFMSYVIYPIINEQQNNLLPTLSQEQIDLATATVDYTDDLSGVVCPITLEEFHEGDELCKIIHCNHIFRKPQLMNWFQRNVKCPVCRYDIRQWQSPSNVSANSNDVRNIINNNNNGNPNEMNYSNMFDPSGAFVFDFYVSDNDGDSV